ncbi:NADH-dependent flavin oxidoreductase [Streptococcus phocae subsp. salmonis]|uniref:NADH-dependent flavin oxidoreductase n=1 Tax=Streptococcus phocae TaxID=119224 RepID=UPI000531DAA4|nr:NADH-dependent flavin oxidoreductase [Streptococcus phocae]KGR73174.1 NADH-dependent flavin oxidoreductase [Streptococcus phocae subsp. salmonis]
MNNAFIPLFSPLTLPNGVVLSNRFVLSPMVTNSSTADGFVSQDDLDYAKRRAASAPLQITGAAYIDAHGQLFEYGFSVSKDEDIAGLGQLAQTMKAQGAKAILQLTHAGRFASHSLTKYGFVYGPSPMSLKSPQPHEVRALSTQQLEELVESYAKATSRAIKAGFDGVEVSSAQRLLIQTFFSTFSNHRQDDYGAQTLKSRSKFGLEVLRAVQDTITREAPNSFILGLRATPEETRGHQIGYSIDEFSCFMDWALDIAQLDYLAIASWGHDVFRNKVRAAGPHQGRLVTQVIKEQLKGRLPIMATGGINTPEKAIEALEHADFVGASTPFVVDPEFVLKMQTGNEDKIRLTIRLEDLGSLAIPKASFKDIVPLMDYGESLPSESRQLFRQLKDNYKEKE